jgi:hypothetical protein
MFIKKTLMSRLERRMKTTWHGPVTLLEPAVPISTEMRRALVDAYRAHLGTSWSLVDPRRSDTVYREVALTGDMVPDGHEVRAFLGVAHGGGTLPNDPNKARHAILMLTTRRGDTTYAAVNLMPFFK